MCGFVGITRCSTMRKHERAVFTGTRAPSLTVSVSALVKQWQSLKLLPQKLWFLIITAEQATGGGDTQTERMMKILERTSTNLVLSLFLFCYAWQIILGDVKFKVRLGVSVLWERKLGQARPGQSNIDEMFGEKVSNVN